MGSKRVNPAFEIEDLQIGDAIRYHTSSPDHLGNESGKNLIIREGVIKNICRREDGKPSMIITLDMKHVSPDKILTRNLK